MKNKKPGNNNKNAAKTGNRAPKDAVVIDVPPTSEARGMQVERLISDESAFASKDSDGGTSVETGPVVDIVADIEGEVVEGDVIVALPNSEEVEAIGMDLPVSPDAPASEGNDELNVPTGELTPLEELAKTIEGSVEVDKMLERAKKEENEELDKDFNLNIETDASLELPNVLKTFVEYSDFNTTIHPANVMKQQNSAIRSALYVILESEESKAINLLRYAIAIMREQQMPHVFSAVGLSKSIQELKWATGQRNEYDHLIYVISLLVTAKKMADIKSAISWDAVLNGMRPKNAEKFTRILGKIAGVHV